MLISNVTNNHTVYIQKLITECADNFIIVSPFLASQMAHFLEGFDFSNIMRIDLVTTFKPKDAEQLTKPFQLQDFVGYFKIQHPDIEVFIHINNSLHGKLYISGKDHKKMILTSANFTRNGMTKNHEWGIWVEDKEVVEEALEEIFDNIDYPELSLNQINKACELAEANIKENPQWETKPKITSDILESVYSDKDIKNTDPQYFLKPIGTSEHPVTLEGQENFSKLHQDLHFSKKKPKGVRKGDIIITTAVGAGSLLSYFRVTGGLQQVTEEQIKQDSWMERWPWYMEGRNNSTKFGKEWWKHNLKRQDLLDKFREIYPDSPITQAGGFTLGTLNMGNDKVRLTKEFGEFLIGKILEYEYSEKEPLKINLDPADPNEFKKKLLESKRAVFTMHYNDGSKKEKLWDASHFSNNSGVYNNIRSHTGFRQGEWQQLNIKYIDVRILE